MAGFVEKRKNVRLRYQTNQNFSMMKKLLPSVLLAMMFVGSQSFAKEFVYQKVIGCGPQKPDFFSSEQMTNAYKFFFIHKASNGDYVIWHDNYQYASFEKHHYHQLYVQNGGYTSTSMQLNEGVERYSLNFTQPDGITRTRIVLFDPVNMTFISRIAGYQPMMGICWNEK